MKIQPLAIQHNYNKTFNYSTEPMFKGGLPVETIKHYNLGIMSNGYVGKVKVLKSTGHNIIPCNNFDDLLAIENIDFILRK